jgi:hypothetical protein
MFLEKMGFDLVKYSHGCGTCTNQPLAHISQAKVNNFYIFSRILLLKNRVAEKGIM